MIKFHSSAEKSIIFVFVSVLSLLKFDFEDFFLLCWWENFEFDTFWGEKFFTSNLKLKKFSVSKLLVRNSKNNFFDFGKVMSTLKAQILKITIFEFSPKKFFKRKKLEENWISTDIFSIKNEIFPSQCKVYINDKYRVKL